jgi:hypothetical protein
MKKNMLIASMVIIFFLLMSLCMAAKTTDNTLQTKKIFKLKKQTGVYKDRALIPPKRFLLNFNDAYLIYFPSSKILQIAAQGNVLSYGTDWKKAKVKSYLYHLKQKFWKNFYWKVNTSKKEVYKVTGGTFGALGGTSQKLDIQVIAPGGSSTPNKFQLLFSKSYLVYVPQSKSLQIAAHGMVLSYGSDWQKCNFNGITYHLKQNAWSNFYWRVITENPVAHRVRGAGAYCNPGAFPLEPLNVDIKVVH